MEEKRLEHPEERQDEKQEKKKQYPVTRRDFYGCVIILLIAVFLQGMQTRALIRREAQNMNNRCQNIESQMWNSISNIQDGIASSLAAGADHSFTAEKEIPFCEVAAVTAILQRGDMEYPSDLGETGVSGAVYPFFSGDFYSTFTWTGGGSEASVSGNVEVEVQPSDWMMQKDKGLTLKNPTVEIYVDGKRVQKHKMQAEVADTTFTRYTYTIEKAFKVKEGQYIEVYFKAEDENGLKYTYLVDRSHVTNGDVETAEPAVPAADSVQEGRLKVE